MRAVELPDGSVIHGRGLRNGPAALTPDRGLYLGGKRLRLRHEPELSWPHEWIAWPDFLLPRDSDAAVAAITRVHEHARQGLVVEVACGGGVGRTGTVIACLAIHAGLPPSEAVAWTRAHYHHRAVETTWQRRWVARFPRR